MRKNQHLMLLGGGILVLVFLVVMQARQMEALKESSGRIAKLGANYETVDRRLARLEKQLRAAETERTESRESNKRLQASVALERMKLKEEHAQLEKKIADIEVHAHAVEPAIAASGSEDLLPDDLATSSSKTEPPLAGLAKMLKDPAMKEMLRIQQKAMLDMSYRSLYESLDIPEAEMKTLKELLLDKQMKQVDLGLAMMDKSLTTEEREAMKEEIEQLAAETDNTIREMLGEEKYELYEYVEDTKVERMQANAFQQSLGRLDRLELEQEENLIFSMHEAREEFDFSTELRNGQNADPTGFTPEASAGLLEDLRRLGDQYVVVASEILTPEQLKQFKVFLEQQRAMQEMGVRMAAEMFGGANGQGDPPSDAPEGP